MVVAIIILVLVFILIQLFLLALFVILIPYYYPKFRYYYIIILIPNFFGIKPNFTLTLIVVVVLSDEAYFLLFYKANISCVQKIRYGRIVRMVI